MIDKSNKSDVKRLQEFLTELGYYKYGTFTWEKISNYINGLDKAKAGLKLARR